MTSWTALREGFDAFTRRLPLLLGVVLVLLAVQQVIDLLIPDSFLWLKSLVAVLVLSPLYAGQYLIALKVVRREPVVFKELFAGRSQIGPIMGAYVLVTLLTVLGAIALVIPGIIVALAYSFTLIRFLDPKGGGRSVTATEAMKDSARITRGYRGTLFGISFLLGIPLAILVILQTVSIYNPLFPSWIAEIVAIFSGALFFGPVQATSYMVVYDHALNHPRG
ncbi:hypothetical protein KAR02_07145 [Candidatus Bipolaricaulota bacterium]|nr:hypothetical protein [Candidatus Bipolaricaulota bacterium]